MTGSLTFSDGGTQLVAEQWMLDWCCHRCRTYGPIAMKLALGPKISEPVTCPQCEGIGFLGTPADPLKKYRCAPCMGSGKIGARVPKPPFDDEEIRRFIWEAHFERTQGPNANVYTACQGRFKDSVFDWQGRSGDFQFGKYLWRYKSENDERDAPRIIVREHPGEPAPTSIKWPPWQE